MLGIVAHATAPAKQIGPHCDNPYVCALHDHCWNFLPEGNGMELYRGKKKGFDLVARGVTRLADIPEADKLTANQKIQRESAIRGQAHIDHETLRKFLARLQYPLHFLHFESFMTAIPDVRPCAALPANTISILTEGPTDPRRTFIDRLMAVVGDAGSIVVCNAAF
jgi:hypothetical protein